MTPEMKELLQRIAVCLMAVRDAEDTPQDIEETAEELLEDIGQIFDRDREIEAEKN